MIRDEAEAELVGCVALLQQMADDATGIEGSALVRSAAVQIVRLGPID